MEPEQDKAQAQAPQRAPLNTAAIDSLDPATFSWDTYCGSYKGRALISRLAFIPSAILASPNPSPKALELARAAALRAIDLVKADTFDHTLYLRLVQQVDATLHPGVQPPPDTPGDEPMDIDTIYARKGSESDGRPDAVWVEETRAKLEAETNRLAVELNGYLSNLIRESIRLTYLAQAQLALKAGSLADVLKAYQQMREYLDFFSAAHHVELGLGIIESALQFNDSAPLAGNVTKIEASLDHVHPPASTVAPPISSTMTQAQVQLSREQAARSQKARRDIGIKLRVARALLALKREDYANTARELVQVGEEGGLQDWEGEVISSADIAFIAAICALASGKRADIRAKLLDRPSFHSSVDDSQAWILDLVRAFVDARYGEALALLRRAEPYMLLNPFLSGHTPALMTAIRTHALVQYLTPFSTVRVSAMASAFNTGEDNMLDEVCKLAESGAITAKIDLVDRVLSLPSPDPRAGAYAAAMGAGKITAQTQANVFRMRLKEADVVVGKEVGEEEKAEGGREVRLRAKMRVGGGRMGQAGTGERGERGERGEKGEGRSRLEGKGVGVGGSKV